MGLWLDLHGGDRRDADFGLRCQSLDSRLMQPHSLATVSIGDGETPAQKFARAGWVARHGNHWPKGTKLPETRVLECPRVKVADLPIGHLKQKHIDHLEQNQLISSCCRHPENHEVAAFKSHKDEQAPDIYEFYCTCGRTHRFFCVGRTDDKRPTWKA